MEIQLYNTEMQLDFFYTILSMCIILKFET